MSRSAEEKQRAWVQARVQQFGGIDRSCPDDFTMHGWRKVCAHYGVKFRKDKASSLDEALRRVADLAG